MASRHDIIHIDFQASAGRANTAIKSIQSEAEKASARVQMLKKQLEEAPNLGKTEAEIKDLRKQIKDAERDSNSWHKAVLDLTKGVTALDEAIKLFNKGKGSVESMSVALAKTARNAAELQQSRITDKSSKNWKEMDALIHALDITITRGKSDLDGLIATIQSGGSASKLVLEQALKDLEALRNSEVRGTEEWKKFDAELQTVIGHVAELNKQELQGKASILNDKNLGRYDETKIRAAIDATKELMKTVATGSEEYKQYAQNIVNAENHLKNYGLEAERTAAREAAALEKQEAAEKQLRTTMNSRLKELPKLSADALAESKKYWEAQVRGAEMGSKELAKYEANLKEIAGQERTRKANQLSSVLQGPERYGISEVQNAVREMERLRDSMANGIPKWHEYNNLVKQGKEYLDQLAKTEAAQRIEKQMQSLNTISEKGLTEVRKYWEAMVAGADRGSAELSEYETNLKRVTAEEQARANAAAQQKVGILSGGNLGNYSENEIRAAIAAGNQLIKTYQTASPEAERLAKNIVAAEEHLKQYGTEAARTALKEKKALEEVEKKRRETDQMMQQQLAKGTALSQQTLKEQERYWQKMIDDPKAAAASLQQYQANLQQVKAIQQQMITEAGQNALSFFRGDTSNASATQLQESAKALKAYRDNLPREFYADVINEINGYLQQTGLIAGEDATKIMSLADAEKLAGTIGTESFQATTEQLKMAKKAIQEAMDTTTEKGSPAYLRLADSLRKVELELNRTGELSAEVQAILDQPKGKPMDELADAIKRAEARMRGLASTDSEYKKLTGQIKNCKEELKNLESQSKVTTSAFEKAWSRLKTYVGVYVSAAVAMQKIMTTFQNANELSDKMGEVGKTTGMTTEQLGHLQQSLSRISTRTAMNELMGLSAAAGQLGLKAEQDVMAFTRAANKITVALPEMGREGVTELMKIAKATGTVEELQRQINHGLIEDVNAVEAALTRVGSTIDALRANSASTAPRITDFVKRVGAVGAQSGLTIDQVAALGSTVDALGMRVEMSATALSRMIPAIRNNAFAISKAIGIAPDEIERMYEAGDAMQIIIKLLRTMGGKNEEEIEGMLNQHGFGDILKDLNQQGARAGMVFAGLAQNVGELERQLDIAHDAFEENIAIEQEYLRMNETSAGKLAQLGNTLTNFFVTASSSKFLGTIYDFLNWFFKNWIENPRFQLFFNTLIGYLVVVKTNLASIIAQGTIAGLKAIGDAFVQIGRSVQNMGGGLKNVKKGVEEVDKSTRAMNTANAWLALAAAIYMAANAIKAWYDEAHKVQKIASEAMARVASETSTATDKLNKFFDSIGNARVAVEKARKEVYTAKEAVDAAKKSLDGSRESTEKLEKAESDLKIAVEKETKANDDHASSFRKLNQEYEPYLGYMLSEISTAKEVANARELINAKLRETITLKQREAAYGRIEEEYGGKRDEEQRDLYSSISKLIKDPTKAAQLRKDINDAVRQNHSNKNELAKTIEGILSGYGNFVVPVTNQVTGKKENYLTPQASDVVVSATDLQNQIHKIEEAKKVVDDSFAADIKAARIGTKTSKGTQQLLAEQLKAISDDTKSGTSIKELEDKYSHLKGTKGAKNIAADLLQQMDAYEKLLSNSKNYYDLTDKDEAESYKKLIENGDKRMKNLREQREELIKVAGDAYQSANNTKDTWKPTNPWGSKATAETPYEQWDADALVARRKSMNTFVRALSEGTDVQSVLKQDAALKNAIEKGMSSDMRTVIAWYNEERLKIQDELHDRNLTNTGAWLDPKKGRTRKPRQIMSEAAVAELERYYEWRKTVIDDARIEEGLSEEEYNRRMEALEVEHLQKRHDLRDSFTSEDEAFIQQFRQWWESVAELDEVEWSGIEAEWKVAWERERKRNNYLAEKDLSSMRAITVKHLNAIQDIIDKERPYDGITANLRKNLTELDILYADMNAANQKALSEGLEKPFGDTAFVDETTKRMTFLLKEAEDAYTLTTEEMMRRMADAGMTAWADELQKNPMMQQALLAQIRKVYDQIQEAIKKESSQIKKEVDIWWADIASGQKMSRKDTFENALSELGRMEDSLKRANSLIGAGQASERVADKLAIKQMQIRLAMQKMYYDRMREIGEREIQLLKDAGRMEDAEHLRKSLNLALTKEMTEQLKLQDELHARTEESQLRLYTELRSWADLFSSSLQSVFEASNTGMGEYYNEMAKLRLTGSNGKGGTYIVIENAGSSDAEAHYEELSDEEFLRRQMEIEQQNASAEAWKKVLDDIAEKIDQTITDQLNAMLQNAAVDANTTALGLNTSALNMLTAMLGGGNGKKILGTGDMGVDEKGVPNALKEPEPSYPIMDWNKKLKEETPTEPQGEQWKGAPWQADPDTAIDNMNTMWQGYADAGTNAMKQLSEATADLPNATPTISMTDEEVDASIERANRLYSGISDASSGAKQQILQNQADIQQGQIQTDKKTTASTQAAFAKMTLAANMYGIAYNAMSNDNLSTAQKFGMMAVQAAGQVAMTMLTVDMARATAESEAKLPGIYGWCIEAVGPIAGPILFGVLSAALGGLLGMAAGAIGKGKSEISQVTGAKVSAGRLATGMLTYAEGNVNEFSDPSTLQEGRSYNVDAADGRTYRARYMGKDAKTHITNGPEFHLVGEKGREAIIDAKTTRNIQMNEPEIWRSIQTLYNGGSLGGYRPRRGIRNYANGNLDEIGDIGSMGSMGSAGINTDQIASLQSSLDRNSEVLERAVREGIKGVFNVYGPKGLIDSYDTGKKTVTKFGQKY